MRTDDLISIIAADHGHVDTAWLHRATFAYALVALAIAISLVLSTLGLRRDFAVAWVTGPVIGKVLFGASLAVIALAVFQKSLRPGLWPGSMLWLSLLPLGLICGLAAFSFAQSPAESWSALILGRYWLTCLIAVPLYALVPNVMFLVLARRGAPVDPGLTGASAGLASAGLAMIGYALHCPDDTAPFVATWNSIAAASVILVSMLIAPRVLRW